MLAHGVGFATPEDTTFLYEHSDAQGFSGRGVSSGFHERAVRETALDFKNHRIRAR